MEATALKQVIIVLVIVIAFAVLLGTAPYVAGQQKVTAPSIDTYGCNSHTEQIKQPAA